MTKILESDTLNKGDIMELALSDTWDVTTSSERAREKRGVVQFLFGLSFYLMIVSLTLAFSAVVYGLIYEGTTLIPRIVSSIIVLLGVYLCVGISGRRSPRLAYVHLLTVMASLLVDSPWTEYSIGGVVRLKWIILLIAFSWIERTVARTGIRTAIGTVGVLVAPVIGVLSYFGLGISPVIVCALLIVFVGSLSIFESRVEILAPLVVLASVFLMSPNTQTQGVFHALYLTASFFVFTGTKARDQIEANDTN